MNDIINKKPLLSIITVCFNSANTIRRTIESVLNQTYTNIEYIVVDGNSTDSTVTILKEYEALFVAKGIPYRYVSEPDKGIYDAMNKGIKMAFGDWINFQGSDDWLELSACENIVAAINLNGNADVIYGISRFVKNDDIYALHQFTPLDLENYNLNHQAVFMKKQLHDSFGYYSLEYKLYSDWDFMLKLVNHVNFFRLESIIVNYSITGLSATSYDINEVLKLKYNHKIINRNDYIKRIFFAWLKKIFSPK